MAGTALLRRVRRRKGNRGAAARSRHCRNCVSARAKSGARWTASGDQALWRGIYEPELPMTRIPMISVAIAATLGLAACEPTKTLDPAPCAHRPHMCWSGSVRYRAAARNVGMTIAADGSISGQGLQQLQRRPDLAAAGLARWGRSARPRCCATAAPASLSGAILTPATGEWHQLRGAAS